MLHLLLLSWEQITRVHCAEVVTNEINFIDEDHYIELTKHTDVERNQYENRWKIPNHVWESIIEDYQENLIDARLMTMPTVSKKMLMKRIINID